MTPRWAHYTERVSDTSGQIVKYRSKHTLAFRWLGRYLILTWVIA